MKDFLQLNKELYELYTSVVETRVEDADHRLASIRDSIRADSPQSIRLTYLNFSRLIAGHAPVRATCLTLPEAIRDGVEMRRDTLLGGIEPGGVRGVSLVTCAMNRTENLLKALNSWLAQSQISEVIIVDWNSRVPVSQSLDDAGVDDPRIRVIRVEDEPRWILSYAFNIGFRVAKCERILKADADIVVADGFFDSNPLPNLDTFIAGNWRTAAADQVHVNGFFYTSRSALATVGGFNEFITTYGWDDDDLYSRLESAGFTRRDVAPGTIHHLDHSDEERTGEGDNDQRPARDVISATPRFMIQRNRILCDMLPGWDGQRQLLPLRFRQEGQRPISLTRAGHHENVVPGHTFDAASRQMLQELMSWDYGPEVRDLDAEVFDRVMQRPLGELSKQAFLDAMASAALPTPGVVSPRNKVFIDAQHGLGNRLRAIGSAAAIAEATDRELVIVWEPDDHCDCRFEDLFDYDGAVMDARFVDEAESLGCDVFNYMTAEPDAQKNAPIILNDGRGVYARAAFVLNSEHSHWTAENAFIQSLTPVEMIRDLVAAVRNPNDVTAHVRMEGGKQFEHLPYESAENWTQEDHDLIAEWRAKSHFDHFMKRLDQLTVEGRAERIFVAADRPETYDAFTARYGPRVAFLPRTAYDRSAEQLRYAMADAILLSRAPLMLGSTWSSFSELAMRLAPGGIAVEMSGKDF
jgi:hypothetical protein